MSAKITMIAMALAAIALFAAACSPAPVPTPKPSEPNAPVATAPITTAMPTAPEASPTVAPTARATPTLQAQAASLEEDCMAVCHIPDPNDYFGAGAKPVPASHEGRTTCLNCHTTAAAPALPDDHLGRLDVACRGCHK